METSLIKTNFGHVKVASPVTRGEAVLFWVMGSALLLWSVAVPLFFFVGAWLNFLVVISGEAQWWSWLFMFSCGLAAILSVGPVRITLGEAN